MSKRYFWKILLLLIALPFYVSVFAQLTPTPSWPVGNATMYSLQPTLSWYLTESSSGLTYEVQCVKANESWLPDGQYATVTDQKYTFAVDLVPGSAYKWQVRSNNGSKKSAWSETAYFTTVGSNGGPTTPVASWPVGNATMYNLQPTLSWYLTEDGTGVTYEVQCVKVGDPWLLDDQYATVTDQKYKFTSDLVPGTEYQWRVRSKLNNTKSGWSEIAYFTTIGTNGKPTAPVTSWPVGNATIYTLMPTLSWYTDGLFTDLTYEVQCVKAGDPWLSDDQYATVTDQKYTFATNLVAGTKYQWHVRSNLNGLKSAWSETAYFTTVGTNGGPIVPIASWPVGNATVYSLQPTLAWYLNESGTGLSYQVQCVKVSEPWLADDQYASVTTLNYKFAVNLTPGTKYQWRVRSTDGSNKSVWSEIAYFTTVGTNGGPTAPITTWPTGNTTIYTLTPTLSWYTDGLLTGLSYEVQCVKAGDPWLADDQYATVTDQKYTFPNNLVAGTQYQWQVRSNLNGLKSAWSETAYFTTVGTNGGPIVPIASWPVGNATIYELQPTLYWYLNGNGTGFAYEVQCVKASDPWLADDQYASVTDQKYTFPNNLVAGTQYKWQVRSNNGGTKSAWSEAAYFTTYANNQAVSPLVGGPTGRVTIDKSEAMLTWYLPTASAESSPKYDLQYSTDSAMTNSVVVSDIKDSKLSLNSLSSGVYYWRVKSKTEKGSSSSYSGAGVFKVANTVLAVNAPKVVPASFKLDQNYPNPFNPATIINFTISEASSVTLKIFDVLGREIKTLLNADKSAGTYSVKWDGRNNNGNIVQSGIYFYRLTSGNNNVAVKKLLLLK